MNKSYDSYRYYHPPRPEIKTTEKGLETYERMGFIGQPKLNGSCAMHYSNGLEQRLMNRHQQSFARELIPKDDLRALHKGIGWNVVVGELMNKSQKDGSGKIFNGCIVLFDIMVHNGQYLIGTTLEERQQLLADLYPGNSYDDYLDKVSNNIYKVKNFKSGFKLLWSELVKVGMYEGLVLKNPKGLLEMGLRPANNVGWQVKCRKPTKNYSY